jgi:hypothetical protein
LRYCGYRRQMKWPLAHSPQNSPQYTGLLSTASFICSAWSRPLSWSCLTSVEIHQTCSLKLFCIFCCGTCTLRPQPIQVQEKQYRFPLCKCKMVKTCLSWSFGLFNFVSVRCCKIRISECKWGFQPEERKECNVQISALVAAQGDLSQKLADLSLQAKRLDNEVFVLIHLSCKYKLLFFSTVKHVLPSNVC